MQLLSQVLRKGDQNENVRLLNQILAQKGFLPQSAIDSKFDDQTFVAVSHFQKSVNITADGVVGNMTWAILNEQAFDLQHVPFADWFNEFRSSAPDLFPKLVEEENFDRIFRENLEHLIGRKTISLNEFIGHFCIIYNETGGTFLPLTEYGGFEDVDDFRNDAYFFGTNHGKKMSYNKAPNCKAGDLLKTWGVISSDEDLEKWNGELYPSDQPLEVRQKARNTDFYKYRGRGLNQVTWRSNYQLLVEPLLGGAKIDDLNNAALDDFFQKPENYCEVFRTYTYNPAWTGRSIPQLITGDFSEYPLYVAGRNAKNYQQLYMRRCQTLKMALEKAISQKIFVHLQIEQQGEEIAYLKKELYRVGLLKTIENDVFDDNTLEAILKFQSFKNLRANGMVEFETMQALLVSKPIVVPNIQLKFGDTGDHILLLDQYLNDLGYLDGMPNDAFDLETYQGVVKFQEEQGLIVDGVVGQKTWERIEALHHSTDLKEMLKFGDYGEKIVLLDLKLKQLGYLDDEANDAFDLGTYNAVVKFQEDHNITVDGLVGKETWQQIMLADTREGRREIALGSSGRLEDRAVTHYLAFGSYGEDVIVLDQKLYELGYLDDSPNDAFDLGTYEAVVRFQEKNGLEATGIVDQEVWEAIMEQQFHEQGSHEGHYLKFGASGEEMLKLDLHLQELGYLEDEPNDAFDLGTYHAVVRFQEEHDLEATGIVDEKTWNKIFEMKPDQATQHYLRFGSSGEEVWKLDQHLYAIGYLEDDPNDAFDLETLEAVLKFQTDQGIEPTGIVDEQTWNRIMEIHPKSIDNQLIRFGDAGEKVWELDQKLFVLGYLTDRPNDAFDLGTLEAVLKFQTDHHLEPTGTVDTKTWDTILGAQPSALKNKWLQFGDSGELVYQLDQKLQELGYIDTEANDAFDLATYEAIVKFQTDHHLKADGMVGEKTWEAIMNSHPKAHERHYLRFGDSGEEVLELDNKLREIGYLEDEANDSFDLATYEAVVRFQKDHDLTVDGIVADADWDKIMALQPLAYQEKWLKFGDSGEDIFILDQRLQELGYLEDEANDAFDVGTYEAVIKFQTEHGLTPDGMVGQKTWQAIMERQPNAHQKHWLKFGDSGEDVLELDKRLFELGYLQGTANDAFDLETYHAVVLFQEKNNLLIDGMVGDKTWDAIMGNLPPEIVSDDLKFGVTNEKVLILGQKLFEKGFLFQKPTEVFDLEMHHAVERLQKQWGLEPTGIAPLDYLEKINELPDFQQLEFETKLQKGDRNPLVFALNQRLWFVGLLDKEPDYDFDEQTQRSIVRFQEGFDLMPDGVVRKTVWKKLFGKLKENNLPNITLRLGDRGEEVEALNVALAEAGYLQKEPDNQYDAETYKAVANFQAAEYIPATGVVDGLTWEVLD